MHCPWQNLRPRRHISGARRPGEYVETRDYGNHWWRGCGHGELSHLSVRLPNWLVGNRDFWTDTCGFGRVWWSSMLLSRGLVSGSLTQTSRVFQMFSMLKCCWNHQATEAQLSLNSFWSETMGCRSMQGLGAHLYKCHGDHVNDAKASCAALRWVSGWLCMSKSFNMLKP